jgi:hypothetical protein
MTEYPVIIGNVFNKFSPSMANNISRTTHYCSSYLKTPNSMFISPVTKPEILDIIANLKNTKPYDHSEIPVLIIKKIAHNILEPIPHRVNQSFTTGTVPRLIKIANMSSIFKFVDYHDAGLG